MKDKVAGVEDTCFTCGTPVICQEAEYQGETKLQWKNKIDGKAHYKQPHKDEQTGKLIYECNKPGETSVKEGTTLDPKFEDSDPIVVKTREMFGREQRIRYALKRELNREPDNQQVGLYLKLVE